MNPTESQYPPVAQPLPNPWRASAWLALLVVLYLAISAAFLLLLRHYVGLPGEMGSTGSELSYLAWLYVAQFVVLVPVVVAISHFSSQPWYETLAIRRVRAKTLLGWMGIWVAYQVLAVLLDQLYQPDTDDFLGSLSGSAHLGLALVVVLLAPIMEEAIFRGYLHKAWRKTRLGVTGTVLLTSFLFTVVHAGQYQVSVLLQLWLLALILGWSREQSGSLVTPWALHTLNNFFAATVVIYAGQT